MSRSPYRPLEWQVAPVTGGSSGIGAAGPVALAGAGAVIGVNYASDPKALRRLLTLIPCGRIGQPEDVARASASRASAEAATLRPRPCLSPAA